VFPSDHFIADESVFIRQVAKALDETDILPRSAVLLGVTPIAWRKVTVGLAVGKTAGVKIARL
jgi:mannose-1-phosphate guanylyltransferase